MATEAEREQGHQDAAAAEAQRFADWKAIQEQAGYTVEGDDMAHARVLELPDGPTLNVDVG